MEAKRRLTAQQREQISQSEGQFINGGITYAKMERERSEKRTAESTNNSIKMFSELYDLYLQNPTASTLKGLKRNSDAMRKR